MNTRNAVVAGFALAVAALTSTANAAPPPVEVRVANPPSAPVPVSVVGGSSTAVNVHAAAPIGFGFGGNVYTNTGGKAVILTAIQARASADGACAGVSDPLMRAVVFVADAPGGGANFGQFSRRFGPGTTQDFGGSNFCVWIADLPAGMVVGPGKTLRGMIEVGPGSPPSFSSAVSVSGHTLP